MSTQVSPSVPTKRLAAPILSTDMSFTLTDIQAWDGNDLVAADFSTGSYGRGVFRSPDNKQIEFFTFDPATIASATITIIARGLDYKGGTTDGVKTKYDWPANTTLVELGSNPPAQSEEYVDKVSNETIAGVKTFSSSPVVPTGGTGTQAANATDIANAVTGASGTATDSVHGTVKLSVAAASVPDPIVVGDNDTRVPTQGENDALVGDNTDIAVGSGNKMVTQTGLQHNAEKYVAVASGSSTAYTATLSPAPTSQTDGMVVYLKMDVANTTTTPTLAVNGLTARTIVKTSGTALAVGDIAAGMLCTFIYDLSNTRWVMQSPVANAPITTAPIPEQDIPFGAGTNTATASNTYLAGNTTGSVVFLVTEGSGSTEILIKRLVRDSGTGQYRPTHSTTLAITSLQALSAATAGSYLYVVYRDNATNTVQRYDAADLANPAAMSVSGTAIAQCGFSWSDGTNLYTYGASNGVYQKYSISGTTLTFVTTVTYTSAGTGVPVACDGTNIWSSDGSTIKKYALAGGAATSTTTILPYTTVYPNPSSVTLIVIGTTALGMGFGHTIESNAAVTGAALKLSAITLP